jgi:hypothetical protein
MSKHLICTNCAAPLPVEATDVVIRCNFCGTTIPIPEDVHAHPVWQREKQLQSLREWYERTRAEHMVHDSNGNLAPPSKLSMVGIGIAMGGWLIGFISSAVLLFAGAIFPPLLILIPITLFGFMLGGGIWGGLLMHRAKTRYLAFQAVEEEYQGRLALLDRQAAASQEALKL